MNDNVYFSTNPDPGQVNKPLDWRTLDVSTPEGLRALDHEIDRRLNGVYWYGAVKSYSTDANAALELYVTEHDEKYPGLVYQYYVMLWRTPSGWHALFADEHPLDAEEGYIADTPALAVCKAWLAFKDEQARQHTDAAAPGEGNGGGE